MKKLLLHIAVFFALVYIFDICCGVGFDYLKSHARGGDTQKSYYIVEKCEDDVLILGSSRAARHYVPKIIEDSLGLSCYNAGQPSCGILPAYAIYKMVLERHKPKLVLYEVTPDFDYLISDPYSDFLARNVRQYYEKAPVNELYSVFGDKFSNLILNSNLYRNNSSLARNIADLFTQPYDKGYEPLSGIIPDYEIKRDIDDTVIPELDSLKYAYFEKLVVSTKEDDVPLIFLVSPKYKGLSQNEIRKFDDAFELAQKHSICYIDANNLDGIVDNSLFFQDYWHLNNNGASEYTKKIISLIKNKIEINN